MTSNQQRPVIWQRYDPTLSDELSSSNNGHEMVTKGATPMPAGWFPNPESIQRTDRQSRESSAACEALHSTTATIIYTDYPLASIAAITCRTQDVFGMDRVMNLSLLIGWLVSPYVGPRGSPKLNFDMLSPLTQSRKKTSLPN